MAESKTIPLRILNRYRILLGGLLFGGLLLAATTSMAQQATEQFIPIGMSPGISDHYSYIGKVLSVNAATNSFTIESNRGTKTIKVEPRTRIWIDRSQDNQSNTRAKFTDIEVGSRCEVMHDRQVDTIADWIKIEAN